MPSSAVAPPRRLAEAEVLVVDDFGREVLDAVHP
jgi:hypothetical protein